MKFDFSKFVDEAIKNIESLSTEQLQQSREGLINIVTALSVAGDAAETLAQHLHDVTMRLAETIPESVWSGEAPDDTTAPVDNVTSTNHQSRKDMILDLYNYNMKQYNNGGGWDNKKITDTITTDVISIIWNEIQQ